MRPSRNRKGKRTPNQYFFQHTANYLIDFHAQYYSIHGNSISLPLLL